MDKKVGKIIENTVREVNAVFLKKGRRSPCRIPKVLKKVRRIWKRHPDLRLGQLICNACGTRDPYYMEDDELVRRMRRLYLNSDR
jgi:hypothetical protein